MHVVLLHPKSSGRVTLHGANPYAPPRIQPHYFKEAADLEALVAGVRLTRRLLQQGDELQVGAQEAAT